MMKPFISIPSNIDADERGTICEDKYCILKFSDHINYFKKYVKNFLKKINEPN